MTLDACISTRASEQLPLAVSLSSREILGTPRSQSEIHASAILRSAVRLLAEARRALSSNKDQANQCLVRAAAILQTESDVREMHVRTAAGPGTQKLAPWQIARVTRFVDDHLAEKMAVSSLAAVARLSSSHFARAFRATVGESPHAYVIRRRIERAQEQILTTGRPLAEIALDCGFGDQAHMTRLFRRVAGMGPGAWRRTHGAAVGRGAAGSGAAVADRTERRSADPEVRALRFA